jgi:hypothetical protein
VEYEPNTSELAAFHFEFSPSSSNLSNFNIARIPGVDFTPKMQTSPAKCGLPQRWQTENLAARSKYFVFAGRNERNMCKKTESYKKILVTAEFISRTAHFNDR